MLGTAKSFSVVRIAPSSSATTLRPASVNSLDRMPPVQPSPTMTTSTSFICVAIRPSLAQVRDADCTVWEWLSPEPCDVLAMHRDHARPADHFPPGLVAIAAIDRIGEHPLHHGLIDSGPEDLHGRATLEGDFCGRE